MPILSESERIKAAMIAQTAHHQAKGGKSYPAAVGKSLPLLTLCANEGPITEPCPSCKGAGRHVRKCSVWKQVTREPVGTAKMNCQKCKAEGLGWAPPVAPTPPVAFAPITTRHLLYHIYPVAGNGAWQRNVAALVARMGLFNGKRIVAIVTDPPTGRVPESSSPHGPDAYRIFGACDSPDAVRAAFGRHADSVEFVHLTNDPDKRESLTHGPLFSRVESLDPTHVTFYGQAKGVTRPPNHPAHEWADVLYRTHLDYWPLVAEQLNSFALTGAFKKLGAGWSKGQSLSSWHYSGSFMWFRNAELFSRNWRTIDDFWGGIEPYPSLHFPVERSGCLFHAAPVGKMNLYDEKYWNDTVRPALLKFEVANAGKRQVAPESRLLNLGCGPFRAEGWVNTDVVRTAVINPDVVTPLGLPLPFPDGHFDRVYAGHVLEHVPWDRVPALLAEVRRVTRAGGKVCVVGPDSVRVLNAWKNGEATWEQVTDIIEDSAHHQYTSPDDEWDAARHHWNAHAARVVSALTVAEFREVEEVPHEPERMAGWPVVDFSNRNQCAVIARAP